MNNRFKSMQEQRIIDENKKIDAIKGVKAEAKKKYYAGKVQYNFYVDEALDEIIKKYCDDNDTTKTKMFTRAIKEFLDKRSYM